MHSYYMEPPLGVVSNTLGQVYTCVVAAAAAHQPTPTAIPTAYTLINSSLTNSTNQLPLPVSPAKQTRTPFPVSYGPPNPVYGGMEAVWHTEFQRLFSRYFASHSHVWFLSPNGPPAPINPPFAAAPQIQYESTAVGLVVHHVADDERGLERNEVHIAQQRWQTFFDSAKVRFCCQECGHGWTSMKGRVVFWFSFNTGMGQGTLMFRLYGQKCQQCKSGHYENAMWYPEEVIKVLTNVCCNIGHFYYGLYQVAYTKSRRAGKPRTPHNSNLCQACQDGVCSERK